jgi:hypothetical protein
VEFGNLSNGDAPFPDLLGLRRPPTFDKSLARALIVYKGLSAELGCTFHGHHVDCHARSSGLTIEKSQSIWLPS